MTINIAPGVVHQIPAPNESDFQQTFQLVLDPVGFLNGLTNYSEDISLMPNLNYGDRPIVVYHPEGMRHLLKNDRGIFAALGQLNAIMEPLTGASSLAALSGDHHRAERKMIMPAFHGERMYHYGQVINQIIDEELAQLQVGQPFLAQNLAQRITLRTIMEVVFGITNADRYHEIIQVTRRLLTRFNSPLNNSFLYFKFLQQDLGPWSPWGNFIRDRDRLYGLLKAEINDRQAYGHSEGTDILSMLMAARDQDGNPMAEQQLQDELMLLLLAGHDTTAIALAWALYWLEDQPAVKDKLRAELANLGPNPDPMAVYRLPYLTAVCNEILRINPVGMFTFPRQAMEKTELLGYEIKPGAIVIGCIYLLHQREELYPQPRQFNPDRFLERQFDFHEFMPFGGGARRCVGEALAYFELRLGLAAFATKAKFTSFESSNLGAKRRGLVLAPRHGVRMKFDGLV